MGYVYPRLPKVPAVQLLEKLTPMSIEEAAGTTALSHPDAAHVATGGQPVPAQLLQEAAREVRRIAEAQGFPRPLTRPTWTKFDVPCADALHQLMQIVPADAASEGVWSFLTLVILPDIAKWRYAEMTPERFLGHPRNTFRKLWWRAEVIGEESTLWEGDWGNPLGEDEYVAIMERPSLAGNAEFARCLAAAVRWKSRRQRRARSELMRDVAKRAIRLLPVICVDALDSEELQDIALQLAGESVAAVSP